MRDESKDSLQEEIALLLYDMHHIAQKNQCLLEAVSINRAATNSC